MNDTGEALEVVFKGSELTIQAIGKILETALAELNKIQERKRMQPPPIKEPKQGKQSLKKLNRKHLDISNLDIEKTDLRGIQKQLKKDGVDFSVKKGAAPHEYRLFFSPRQNASIEYAIENALARAKGGPELPAQEPAKGGPVLSGQAGQGQAKGAFGGKNKAEILKEAKTRADKTNSTPKKAPVRVREIGPKR